MNNTMYKIIPTLWRNSQYQHAHLLLSDHGYFNDVYKNRYSVDKAAGIECNRSLLHLYRRNQPKNRPVRGGGQRQIDSGLDFWECR